MSLLTKRTCFRGNKWGDKGGQTKARPTGIAVTLNQRGAEKGIQISPPFKEGSTQIQENTMAVDKSYGSGKSRTAANSNARARVAAGRFTKGKKRAVDNLVSRNKAASPSMARDKFNPKTARGAADALEFATGVRVGRKGIKSVDPLGLAAFMPLGKVLGIASRLGSAGKVSRAARLIERSAIAEAGRAASKKFAAANARATGKAALGNKKFQGMAGDAWEQKWLGESLKEASRTARVPKKASLAIPPTIGSKLANANRANTIVRGAETSFNNALRAAKGKSFGVLENLETSAAKLQRLRSRGVPKRGR